LAKIASELKKGEALMLILSDKLWNEIKNVIPVKKSKIGRPQKDPKLTLSGIFYIMTTGAQWHQLPDYYGHPTTVHGRFRIWVKSGTFNKILLKSIDAAVNHFGIPKSFLNDTSSVKAPFAKFGGKNPTDRAKNGVKKGIVIDWNRIILSVLVSSANQHDSKLLVPHIENIKKFLERPKVMSTDSAWDSKKLRKTLAHTNIALHASTNVRRNKSIKKINSGGRWKIEQIFGIHQWNRGIKFCWTKTPESFLSLCQLASAVHNFRLVGIFG
jgi:putative transposase